MSLRVPARALLSVLYTMSSSSDTESEPGGSFVGEGLQDFTQMLPEAGQDGVSTTPRELRWAVTVLYNLDICAIDEVILSLFSSRRLTQHLQDESTLETIRKASDCLLCFTGQASQSRALDEHSRERIREMLPLLRMNLPGAPHVLLFTMSSQ